MKTQEEGPTLLIPLVLSTLAKERTTRSEQGADDSDNSVLSLAVTRVVRQEDGSGEYAEGRWEDRSRGNIGDAAWNYRVQGPFRAYLSYAAPDFPDAPQPYKCYAIQGEVRGTCVSWVEVDLQGKAGAEGKLDVPEIRIPFAAQVLCYTDSPRKRSAMARNVGI